MIMPKIFTILASIKNPITLLDPNELIARGIIKSPMMAKIADAVYSPPIKNSGIFVARYDEFM